MAAGPRYGFIGGGVMAEAILRGLLQAGLTTPESVLVSEPVAARREALAALGVQALDDNRALSEGADVVILAVKPGVVADAVGTARLGADHLLVSIAAGVPLAAIETLAGLDVPVVRVMPNVLASVGAGAAAISGGANATEAHLAVAEEIFATVGRVVRVPEAQLDAVTGLSGSGPAYVMLIIEALADGGVQMGLPRETALTLATQTVLGSAKLLAERGDHPGVWKDRVATPGGTTIYGLAELESSGVRGALMRAVAAATRRAQELSEKH